jgi:outer membrane immunogenic protein
LRGRVGYAFNRSLVYFTGGLAVTEIDFAPTFQRAPIHRGTNKSTTEAGWVIGGGWEYGLAQNWRLKGTPAQATFRNSLSDLDVNIVRGAVNYKF